MLNSISGYGKQQTSFGSRFYVSNTANSENRGYGIDYDNAMKRAKETFFKQEIQIKGSPQGRKITVPDICDQYFQDAFERHNVKFEKQDANQ